MKKGLGGIAIAILFAAQSPAQATGVYSCDSGPRDTWQSQDQLKKTLIEQGWQVRRIKEDGGCWEVYAIDPAGKRVEAYFDPRTLKNVYTSTR